MRKLLTTILTLSIIATFFHAPTPVRAATLTKAPNNLGLVGYWGLDEGAGTLAGDMSGNGNTATFYGSPAWVNGKRGKALSFNGSTPDYLKTSGTLGAPTSVTVSAWMKADDTAPSNFRYIVNQGRDSYCSGYSISLYQGNVYFSINTNSANDGCEASPGTAYTDTANWHHVVGVYDQTTAYIYVDGVLRNSSAASISGPIVYKYSEVLNIGKMSYGEPTLYFPFDGLIDDVRVYSRALSSTDVSNLYRSGQVTRKAVSERGLVGYWPLDEGRGVTAGDSSGNGNTGAITGGTWANGKRGKALSFNGTSSCINLGTSATLRPQDGTYTAWVKLSSLPSDGNVGGDIFSNYSGNSKGMFLSILSSGYVQLRPHPSGTVNSAATISVGQWYHVVGTIEGTATKVYINGVLSNSSSGTYTPPDAMNASIGCWVDIGVFYFPGLIDDVRVYNRALSAAEILNLYKQNETTINANTNSRITDGLVGAWSFNGNNLNMASTTAEILDVSGNNNNGDNSGGRADAGRIGQGWYCTTDDQVTLPDIAAAASTGSYSLWVKPDSTDASQGWIDSNFDIFQWSGSSLYFRAGNQSAVSIASWKPNEWHHIVMTWDGTNYYGYIDGAQVTTGIQVGNRGGSLYLCKVDAGFFYSGSIDEVRVYNRALSSSEVLQLYNMGK